jgi:4-amino-4-deoxy-L-arabinose transferase-like glycosyltransferase
MSALTSASGRAFPLAPPSPVALLWWVTLASLAARLIVGALAPLTEDEAYYRLWSMRPAFGYFDHPPMIAWLIWLGRRLAGDTALGVRLAPSLCTAAAALVTADLARLAGLCERASARAGVWLNATALIGLGGELAVPDAPNTLFWAIALWCGFKAQSGRPPWWLGAGIAAGLACLSKYSALFLAPGMFLWLVASANGRSTLRSPWPWLGAALALALFSPNIAWNAQHHWMTFAKQFGRVRPEAFAPSYLAKLLVDQFLLLNPIIAVFLGLAVRRGLAGPLLLVCAPFAAYLLLHSLHGEVQGQWPAPLHPAAVIAAAAAADQVEGWLRRLRTLAGWIALAVYPMAAVFLLAPLEGRLPFHDPAQPLRGWPSFFQAVEQRRIAAGAAWIGAPTYGLAAELAAAPQIHAPATEIFERERFTFETTATRADFARPGLVVAAVRSAPVLALGSCFGQVDQLAPLVRSAGPGAAGYAVFRVARPRLDVERLGCPVQPKR